jgi:hypothetical protein
VELSKLPANRVVAGKEEAHVAGLDSSHRILVAKVVKDNGRQALGSFSCRSRSADDMVRSRSRRQEVVKRERHF